MSLVVVGVDQSDGAKAALAFAHEEARLRNATLRAVHAWQFGYIGYTGFEGAVPALGGDIAELRAAAVAALDATVRAVLPDPGGVEIEQRVVEGTAGAVLVDESSRADLLVVGSRGHGGFAQLLLGSVGQQCAHHAACPVVIVRPKAEAAAPPR
ncbi:MAG TPA: universal stress protein [Gaiellaceae bacterium]|nr:universal stress protein [Gaiellaceae bacterium]